MHSFTLTQLTTLKFADARIQSELQRALARVHERKLPAVATKRFTLHAASVEASATPLQASFCQKNARWTLSYRLMIGKETHPSGNVTLHITGTLR